MKILEGSNTFLQSVYVNFPFTFLFKAALLSFLTVLLLAFIMSIISLNNEPNVIDEILIKDSILDNSLFHFFGDGTTFDKSAILQLSLEYKSLVKINNLDSFGNITRLNLANNLIDKIDGLSFLTQVMWLDLSFNLIQKIENLDTLLNLKDLCLSHNQIKDLDGLDNLCSLQSLTLGFNLISNLLSISYFRKFEKLRSLRLDGNPIHNDPNYMLYIVAHVPQLIYCDFTIISPSLKADSLKRYKIEIQLLEEKSNENNNRKAISDGLQLQCLIEESAFVSGLNSSQFFTELLIDDNQSLNLLNGVDEIFQDFKEKFLSVSKSCALFSIKEKDDRQAEINLFKKCLDNFVLESDLIANEKILHYQDERSKFERLLLNECDELFFHERIFFIRSNLRSLHQFLLKNEMQIVDQLDAIIQEFERNLNELFVLYLESIRAYFAQFRDIASSYFEKLNEICVFTVEGFAKNQLDFDPPEEIIRLLMDKESLFASITSSHDTHLSKIDNKEDMIHTNSLNYMKNIIDKTYKVENQRGRFKIAEINNFMNSQTSFLFDLEEHAVLN